MILVSDAALANQSVFHVEDRAEVKSAGIAGNEDCVKEAANACPVCAIEVA